MRRVVAFFALAPACAWATSLSAQSDFPVSVSVGTHALTVPWYPGPVAARLNPALMVGTDHTLSGDRWRVFLGFNVGVFRDHWWMSGVSLEPEVGVGRSLPGGLYTDLRLGIGYMHYFWRRKTLKLQDGRYVEAATWGKPSLVLPLSFTLGYRGDPDRNVAVAPFVSARWAVQGLFLPEVPALTHLFLFAGLRIVRNGATPDDGS